MDLEKTVVQRLIKQGLRIAVAESLTGGMLASRICDVPGASKVLLEGIVSYSEASKISRLSVSKEMLAEFSPVSQEVAQQMARGVRNHLGADIGLSTTGVAGPDPMDNRGNPKGLYYIGISAVTGDRVVRFNSYGNRNKIREDAVISALELVLETINGGVKDENY